MEHYAVNKEFLEKLGFNEFEKIEGQRINSWWDLDFINNKVKEYFEDNRMSLEDYEGEIETITSCVLNGMDQFNYSDVNEMIMDSIINETSYLLFEEQVHKQARRIFERIKADEDAIHRYKWKTGTLNIHNIGEDMFKIVKNFEDITPQYPRSVIESEDPYYFLEKEVDETQLILELKEVLYREYSLVLIQNSKVNSHEKTDFPF